MPSISRTAPEASCARTRTRAGPDHLLAEVRHGQAALLLLLLARALEHDGVDQHDHGARIGPDREVDDGDLLVDADLRRGESDARGGVAGLDHVGDQAGEVLGRGIDVGVSAEEPRIAVANDVANRQRPSPPDSRRGFRARGAVLPVPGFVSAHVTGRAITSAAAASISP